MDVAYIEPGKENQSPPHQNRPSSPGKKVAVKIDEHSLSPRTSIGNPKLSKAAQDAVNTKRAKQRWARLSRGEGLLDPNYHRKSTLRGSFMKMNRSGSLLETTSQQRFENTYRLEPKSKPKLTECTKITDEVLKMTLDGEKYHHIDSKQLQLGITNEIKSRLKEMKLVPDCYKIVVHSLIGQIYVEDDKKGIQSQVEIRNASRALDMTEFDTHYSVQYMNSTMFCVVTVYLVTTD